MSDHELSTRYFDEAIGLLTQVREREAANVSEAGRLLADTITAGSRVFAYGAGHSALAAQDIVYRAGGLAVINLLAVPGAVGVDVVPATLGSALERVTGLAGTVLDSSPARADDLLIVISLSGRNALPVEMAQHARSRGLRVLGVTSLAYRRETTSRHSSGTYLADHCDLVLDCHIPVGDATLTAPGIPAPFAPASTIVFSALLQATVACASSELAARGTPPPLLRSGNVDGGPEWNEKVMRDNADRIFYL